jgi:PIN domain nuclease of toxin-antitoxin system
VTAVLDAWAVIAYLDDEPTAPRIERLLATGQPVMSSINLGEVLYWSIRERGEQRAMQAVDALRSSVAVEQPDLRLVFAAARIKARGGVSYADAFCVATAERHELPVWTGDPEIVALAGDGLDVVDLRSAP